MQVKSKRAVSALVATVLLILVTVAAIGIIWGAIMPMINQAMQLNQACMNAQLSIDTTRGYTCYDKSKKQASIMIARGVEDFELAGMQLGLASEGEIKSYTVEKDINLFTNGDFELWSAGPSSPPDGWVLDATGTVATEETIKKIGSYSAALSSVSGYKGLAVNILDINRIIKGNTYTFGGWIYGEDASSLRLVVAYDGTGGTVLYSDYAPSGSWAFETITFTIPSDATYCYPQFYVSGGKTGYCDGAMLVEGPEAVIWEENTIYGELPSQNEAKTYKLPGENITEATVAPIVQVGTTEKACDVSSKVEVPRCA